MKVLDGIVGESYVVADIELEPEIVRRLEILGMTEGAAIEILNKKGGGSVILKVRGTRLAVGKKIAAGIRVGSGA